MLTINANGSKWAGDSPDMLECFEQRLRENTLDPRFEKFGNFVDMTRNGGVVHFWGNFYDLSAVFSIDTDDPVVIERLTSAIRANQATPAYLAAREEHDQSDRQLAEYYARRDAERQAKREDDARRTLGL